MEKLWLRYTPEEAYRRKIWKKRIFNFVGLPVLAIIIGLLSALGANAFM